MSSSASIQTSTAVGRKHAISMPIPAESRHIPIITEILLTVILPFLVIYFVLHYMRLFRIMTQMRMNVAYFGGTR